MHPKFANFLDIYCERNKIYQVKRAIEIIYFV